MRTKKELESKEFQDDMSKLHELLDSHGVEHSYKRHIGAESGVKELIGYYPTGEWHIRIGDISVIRGMVSFGDYEAYGGKFKDPERFSTAEEVLEAIKK